MPFLKPNWLLLSCSLLSVIWRIKYYYYYYYAQTHWVGYFPAAQEILACFETFFPVWGTQQKRFGPYWCWWNHTIDFMNIQPGARRLCMKTGMGLRTRLRSSWVSREEEEEEEEENPDFQRCSPMSGYRPDSHYFLQRGISSFITAWPLTVHFRSG